MENNKYVTLCSILVSGFILLGMLFLGGTPLPCVLAVLLIIGGCFAIDRLAGDFSGLFTLSAFTFGAYGLPLLFDLSGIMDTGLDHIQFGVIVLLGLLLPQIYGGIIAVNSHDVERNGFSDFFNSVQTMAAIGYGAFIIFWIGFYNAVYLPEGRVLQLIPFATFAGYIEALLVGSITLKIFLLYLAFSVVVFIPFGFFVQMYFAEFRVWSRLLIVFLLPLILEILQFAMKKNVGDIDDLILGFAGGAIGMLLFTLADNVFMTSCGRGITGRVRRYSFE